MKNEEDMPSSLMTRILRPPVLREPLRLESKALGNGGDVEDVVDHMDEAISGLLLVVRTPIRLADASCSLPRGRPLGKK